jgi:hypothetical protein
VVVVLAESEGAPSAVGFETHAEVVGGEFAVVELELVGGLAVDDIDAELVAPVVPPFGLVKAFEDEDEFLDVLREAAHPLIVFGLVVALVGREELDDGTQGTFGAENGTLVRPGWIAEAIAVIARQQFGDQIEIALEVRHENRAGDDGVGDGLGNLGLAAAGDGAGFVTEDALADGADEAPGTVCGRRSCPRAV